jgi:beta-lactamase regulating signal transducer with metallopeptidase domain/protocatechuate 3,4-dioxygenase beta subunit
MMWHSGAFVWLIHAAVGGSLFLAAGCLAVVLCRQPVRRIRLIELTLAGAMLVPLLAVLPGLPHWPMGWWTEDRGDEPTSPAAFEPTSPAAGAELLQPRPATLSSTTQEGPATTTLSVDSATEAAAASLPAIPAGALSLPATLLACYAAVVVVFLGRGLVGVLRLKALRRQCGPVSPAVREVFLQIAGPAGRRVQLLACDGIEVPLMYAWWQPTILLPASLCHEGDPAALRYCLAHEWSHAERGDAWRWYLASLGQLLFFYQPLFWWLRRQLRLCQDYLADARAADAGQPEDYAEYLVTLARRCLAVPAVGLGISGRRSNLYRRALMLLQPRQPLERRCLAAWSTAACLAAAVLLGLLSAVRLDGPAARAEEKPAPAKETPKTDPAKGETLHYTGIVVAKGTGKPIAGAVVTVRRSLYGDPEQKDSNPIMQETKHTTDAAGKYSFTIPPEQTSKRYLYIELDVEHQEFAPQKGFGYALSMIRKNEKVGGRPFFERIELKPGKAITGTVLRPDGKAAEGVRLLAYSKTDGRDFMDYGSFADAKTDAAGHFRLVLTATGPAVFWIIPEDYAISTHGVRNDKRGELGTFTLHEGIRLRGVVLDTRGKPMPGVIVSADGHGGSEELQGLPVADSTRRSAKTDGKGEFTMRPLPPGVYQVKPEEYDSENFDRREPRRPLTEVFLPKKVTLKAGIVPEPLEVRASPSVLVEAQYYDSKGKTTRGHAPFVFGQIDGGFWFHEAKADANGKVTIRVPHGLEQVHMQLSTNEHGSLRWRREKGKPLSNAREIDLGTLTDDVRGIEIIRYVAPIVVVKVKAADGGKLTKPGVVGLYNGKEGPAGGRLILKNNRHSDISFEEQEDGRFRSEQMSPDREITIQALAEGYKPNGTKIKLPEGEMKEIEIVLEKEAANK